MSERKTAQLPWQGVLALAAAIAGTVLYLAPLETSRPVERTGILLKLKRDQDVDARLWQDPLATAFAHEEQVRAIDKEKDKSSARREDSSHSLGALCSQIDEAKRHGELCVLPVLVSGGSYAEYGENRLRARRAVLEALGTNHLSPHDGEHIGYVRMVPLDFDARNWPAACDRPQPLEISTPEDYFLLPYEWYGPAFVDNASRPKQVLILWVREEELKETPLAGLASLLQVLAIDPRAVKIIGPRTSTALRAVVQEVTNRNFSAPNLNGATIFSPTATVAEQLLLRGKEALGFKSVKALLKDKVPGLSFYRTTLTDEQVCRALITELGRRRVYLCLREAPEDHSPGSDHVALISEWDTFYGRALPLTFAREVSDWDFEKLSHEYPENIHAFHYLRGIDGLLPGGSTQEQAARNAKKAEQSDRPLETIEGLNQADYLRRLAVQLEEKHRILIREGRDGLKAVGVLGSDVYDKLLVLKALRRALPGVLFFTHNLDARFGHPDEWNCARNLIVASPFGLQLAERAKDNESAFDLQGKILPFRDGYQTATYLATLCALNDQVTKVLNDALSPPARPRLFEIARSGPYELHGSIRSKDKSDLHPTRDLRWWSPARVALAVGIGLALAGLIAWTSLVVSGDRRGEPDVSSVESDLSATASYRTRIGAATYRVVGMLGRLCRFSSWAVFGVGALFSWMVVVIVAYVQRSNGEPFLWMEGISIWPTEVLRLLVFIMAAWYLFKSHRSLNENEATILDDFDLHPPELFPRRHLPPLFSGRWWRQIIGLLSVRNWCVDCKGKVMAQKLWRRYVRAGRWRVRLFRVVPLTACYIGAAVCLMTLLGAPPVPGRGELSFELDRIFLALAVTFSVGVTFYIADATTLNRRLIDHLVEEETKWPPKAYLRLRQRWPTSAPGAPVVPAPASSRWRRVLSLFCRKKQEPAGSDRISPPERPPNKLLDEYLDIDLIATRTEVVGELIYYPFVLITLLIVSRISLFDNWTWPVGLFVVIAGNGGYAAWSAMMLRKTAESARQIALGRLNDILIARTAEGLADGPEAQTARETISMIKAETRGAFASTSHHPLIGALLLPSGGAGIWVITQYLPGLF